MNSPVLFIYFFNIYIKPNTNVDTQTTAQWLPTHTQISTWLHLFTRGGKKLKITLNDYLRKCVLNLFMLFKNHPVAFKIISTSIHENKKTENEICHNLNMTL